MSTPQLLMIEDDTRLAQMVGEYLTQSGFGFAHAADGASGLALLQERSPDLVILDEPTTALDVTTQIEVLRAFRRVVRERRATAVYVSHDLAVVAQMADHILVLRNGQMRAVKPELFRYACSFFSIVRRSPQPSRVTRAFQECLLKAHGSIV